MPDWLVRAWRAPWLWMALIVILFCAPLFRGLDNRDYDNDEAIYSFSVDMMLKTGDWITPKMIPTETVAFLEKPPLKFWITGLPIRWGWTPANEFGMRFWDALMASIAFLYVFAIGRRLAGPLCGVGAVYLLFTHAPLMLEHGLRTNNMESAVFLTYVAGIYHYLAWRSSGPDSRGHVIAMALYFVLGFMTKFVAALFLPLVLVMAAALKRDDRIRVYFQWRTFVLGALLAIGLIAPWFVYEYFARGPRLFTIMFGAHVVKRFTGFLDPTHLHPWYFYFTTLWSGLTSAGTAVTVVLGSAMVLWRVVRERWLEGALLILWFVVPMALISTGTSKLYHYTYPFLPPVALAGGYAVARIAAWLWRLLGRAGNGVITNAGRIAAPVAAVVLLLPVTDYPKVTAEMQREVHPLQDLRTCLTQAAKQTVAAGHDAPAVFVVGHTLSHMYTYYFYSLGPWQPRDMASSPTIAMHLYAPQSYQPVLLEAARYDDFARALGANFDDVLDGAARQAGLPAETLRVTARASEVGLVSLNGDTLLLPGPYGSCATQRLPITSR